MTHVFSVDSISCVYAISNHGPSHVISRMSLLSPTFLICAIAATVNMKITQVRAKGERGLSKAVIDAGKTESCVWHWRCQYVLYMEDSQIAKILNVC